MTKFKVYFKDANGKKLTAIVVFEPDKNHAPDMNFDTLYVEEILDVSDKEEKSIIAKYEDIILNEAEKMILAW